MRDIKFRAWDKENEKMLEVANISFDKEAYGYDLITIDKAKESPMPWTFNRLEDFVLMQYAGLKDKNGVEIYEGDYLSLIVFEANREYKGEVVFSKGSFCVVVQIKGHEYKVPFHEISEVDNLLEILGNVYENPELLEVAE